MHICNALSLTPDLKASHQIKPESRKRTPARGSFFISDDLQAFKIIEGLLAIAALVERFAGRRAKE
jgi:hypothetical protein